jgi:hypothetical protein
MRAECAETTTDLIANIWPELREDRAMACTVKPDQVHMP